MLGRQKSSTIFWIVKIFINKIDLTSFTHERGVSLFHENLNDSFLSRASERGLVNLRGHAVSVECGQAFIIP